MFERGLTWCAAGAAAASVVTLVAGLWVPLPQPAFASGGGGSSGSGSSGSQGGHGSSGSEQGGQGQSEVSSGGGAPALRSLKGIAPPLPDLAGILVDKGAAIALGKALFWDSSVGSDGQACASCHFHAGADSRYVNQLDPDIRGVPSDTTFQATPTGGGGPNYALRAGDFPLHQLLDPKNRQSAVLFDSNDVFSSAGVFAGNFVSAARTGTESCKQLADDVFHIPGTGVNAGKQLTTRRVEPRNTPTVINAAYNYRNFWDGRANNVFNGSSPFGLRDAAARIVVADATGHLSQQPLALANASLASQAVGPATSDFEMSCTNRGFADIGKKLLSLHALASQAVDPSDSVLGPLRAPTKGLSATYLQLVKQAFAPQYWSGTGTWRLNAAGQLVADPAGYTEAELNFSMFWGVSVMLYEATLVSDDSPFDRYMMNGQHPVPGFGDAEKRGLNVFTGKGDCASCHAGPLFTKAAVAVNGDQVLEFRQMANGGVALTDTGFANIGARPTRDDQGVGALDPFNGPLSFAREFVTSPAGAHADPFHVNLGVLPGNFSSLTQRVAVDGAMKVPTLRNIAQTPPYFHNGGQGTLQQVIEFYNRGGDRRDVAGGDTSGTGPLGEDDALATGPRGSNVDDRIKPRSFNAQDESDLVAFLRSLTDDRVRCHAAPFDHPELTVSHGANPSATPNGVRAAELTVTLAAVGRNGIAPAKCAAVPNLGDVAQLPAVMNALKK